MSPSKKNDSGLPCETWQDYFDKINNTSIGTEDYIYRGQKEDWKLLPKFHRPIPNLNNILTVEAHLSFFKKSLKGRRGINPPELDDKSYWALGQHYGLETPLLDWTLSPYVAAFFAFEEEGNNENRVVYALNRKLYNTTLKTRKQKRVIKFVEPVIDENSRLISQRGIFTYTEFPEDIESVLRYQYSNPVLVKIFIPNKERKEMLIALDKMNINHYTLFPDLEGSAKYSNMYNKVYATFLPKT